MSTRKEVLPQLREQIVLGTEIANQAGNAQDLFGAVADTALSEGFRFRQNTKGSYGITDDAILPPAPTELRPFGYEETVAVRNELLVGVDTATGERFVGRSEVDRYLELHPELGMEEVRLNPSGQALVNVMDALIRWAPASYLVTRGNCRNEVDSVNARGIRLAVVPKVLRFVMAAPQGYAINVANDRWSGRGSRLGFSGVEKSRFAQFCGEAIVLPSDLAAK